MFRKLKLFLLLVFGFSNIYADSTVQHELLVELQPAENTISVIDTIRLPPDLLNQAKKGGLSFVLYKGDDVRMQTEGLSITAVEKNNSDSRGYTVPVSQYSIRGNFTKDTFTVEYKRKIKHMEQEVLQGMGDTPGLISETGVYLANESAWFPRFGNEYVSFTLTTKQPAGWLTVSQGARIYKERNDGYNIDTWQESSPQNNIYLIAARFQESSMKAGNVEVFTFLRNKDDDLAQRYLGVSSDYLLMYEKLLGEYPYKKFALVENFWETGYGMPSFTLLGERVIRLPFILHSSYPHELVHNWWGNSVYVDYEYGNWSEGLTSYLADHLIKEQRGGGANYRRSILQKYTNFTQQNNDFALDKFIFRQDQASEAVGYGKTMMLFHMLRKTLGDDKFKQGLKDLYSDFKFRQASFWDIEKIYSKLAFADLHDFFTQWIERVGAPSLAVGETAVNVKDGQYTLSLELVQAQSEAPYAIHVPVAVTLEGQQYVSMRMLPMQERISKHTLKFGARPLRIDVDPFFDIFRRLDPRELPPALSQIFGAKRIVAVLPSAEAQELIDAYKIIVESWRASRYPQIEIVLDNEMSSLPEKSAVFIFGEKNIYSNKVIAAAKKMNTQVLPQGVELDGEQYAYGRDSIVLVYNNDDAPDQAMGFISLHDAAAASAVARKLPHYGKYGYLVFKGNAAKNIAKGQWASVDSPLSKLLGGSKALPAQYPSYPALIGKF